MLQKAEDQIKNNVHKQYIKQHNCRIFLLIIISIKFLNSQKLFVHPFQKFSDSAHLFTERMRLKWDKLISFCCFFLLWQLKTLAILWRYRYIIYRSWHYQTSVWGNGKRQLNRKEKSRKYDKRFNRDIGRNCVPQTIIIS